MELSDNKKKEYIQRLLLARIRILNKHSFHGLLLMNTKFGIDLKCDTAYTDGTRICFSPKFMDKLAALNIEPAVSLSIVKDDNKSIINI